MTMFQRARSEQQREIRRRAILDTVAAMLDEMPAAEVSLNEISRRVGLAKSNVLRYFESREAILLDLLADKTVRWTADLDRRLAAEVDQAAPLGERVARVASVVAASLTGAGVLCDLMHAQAGVLERNVSDDVALTYKRAALAGLTAFAGLLARHIPELGEDDARAVGALAGLSFGALWTHARPSPSVRRAYEADPAVAALRIDFRAVVADLLTTLLTGRLALRGVPSRTA